ncbi:MAG: DUF4350 domain-containing protein, partial [Polyangiales bacterium]
VTLVEVGAPLASLEPIKKGEAATTATTLLIDAERTPLDEDAASALEQWLRGGGRAIVVGDFGTWPKSLDVHVEAASETKVRVRAKEPPPIDDEDDAHAQSKPPALDAEIAHGASITIRNGESVATIGDEDYAQIADVRDGRLLALANGELFTNAALLHKGNPAALVAILSTMGVTSLRLVRPEDGSSAAGDPLSALVHAGLGPALAQSAFALVLLFVAYGVAFGRRLPPRVDARRAFGEHVRAVGALWSKTRIGRHALGAYLRWTEARVREAATFAGEEPALLLSRRTGRSLDDCRAIWSTARARADDVATKTPLAIAALTDLSRLVHDAHLTERYARDRAGQPRSTL